MQVEARFSPVPDPFPQKNITTIDPHPGVAPNRTEVERAAGSFLNVSSI